MADLETRLWAAANTLRFLDPHEALGTHEREYTGLFQVHESIKPPGISNALLWHRLGPKTLELVHGDITAVKVTGTGLAEVVVDPDAFEAMRSLIRQGELDLNPEQDLLEDPVTIAEVLTVIDRRIKRLLADHDHPVYRFLAEQIERLRRLAITRASDSIEFLKKALEVARLSVIAERLDVEGQLDTALDLLDPNIGALTQIVEQYRPDGTPLTIDDLVRDIDAIAKQVAYAGWNKSQPGDREARKQIRLVLAKFSLPPSAPLFDNTYAYIRENY